jgi:hypothetical protein
MRDSEDDAPARLAPNVSSLGLPPGALFLDGYAHVSRATCCEQLGVGKGVGPADLAVDRQRHRLLIPVFNRNEPVILSLRD